MHEIILPCKHCIPYEIVDMIADYHDYEKYCKPQHYEVLKRVINDIGDMGRYMESIQPRIARECWGALSYLLEENNYHLLEYYYNDDDYDDYDDYDDDYDDYDDDYDDYDDDDEEEIIYAEYIEYLADW